MTSFLRHAELFELFLFEIMMKLLTVRWKFGRGGSVGGVGRVGEGKVWGGVVDGIGDDHLAT